VGGLEVEVEGRPRSLIELSPEGEDRILILPPKFPYGGPYGYFSSALLCPFLVGPLAPFSVNRACAGPVPPFKKRRTTTTPTPPTTEADPYKDNQSSDEESSESEEEQYYSNYKSRKNSRIE
jgi:hypothetical protein